MAEVSALALLAELTNPYIIKLVHGLFYYCRIVSQYASFKISFVFALHANTGTCQVGAADTDLLKVKDEHLEVNSWTEHPLQTVVQDGVPIEVLPKGGTWFLSMNEPHLHTLAYQLRQQSQERFLLLAWLHIEVFDVSSTNPKSMLHGLHS